MLKIDRLSEERMGEKAGREEGEKRGRRKDKPADHFPCCCAQHEEIFFSPTMMISNDAELSSWDFVPAISRS
jgi:hypothetical protein